MPETEINTFLKKALDKGEHEGQTFSLPSNPSYRDFDHVVEVAYAIPILKDLKASYQHKTGVKDVVRMFLERKTFAVPAGMPISFDKVIEAGDARIALGKPRRRRPAFLSVSGFFPFGRSRDRRADGPV